MASYAKRGCVLCASMALGAIWATAASSLAPGECSGDARAECVFDVMGDLNDVIWSGEKFVAVGLQKEPAGLGRTAAIVYLTDEGSIDGDIIPIEMPRLPAEAAAEGYQIARAIPNKVVSLERGDILIFGLLVLTTSDPQKKALSWGWVARRNSDGSGWSRPFGALGEPDQIFHSGLYDPVSEKLVAVGRRQSGGDAALTCEHDSAGFMLQIDPETGLPASDGLEIKSSAPYPRNRQAIYDIALMPDGGGYVLSGFKSGPRDLVEGVQPEGCRDHLLIAQVSGTEPAGWQAGVGVFEPEVPGAALKVITIENGDYLIAGADTEAETPAAILATVRANPLTLAFGPVPFPFPPDEADNGSDRFRAVTTIPDSAEIIAAGSKADLATKNVTTGWWLRIRDDNLVPRRTEIVEGFWSSVLNGVAAAPDGRTIVVGRAQMIENGDWFGYARGIQDPTVFLLGSLPPASDSNLVPIQQFQTSLSEFEIPSPGAERTRYEGIGMAAQQTATVSFVSASQQRFRFAIIPSGGDIDLLLTRDGALIDFSNFSRQAIDVIEADLAAGQYDLVLSANTDIESFELLIEPAALTGKKALENFARISAERRERLNDILIRRGYSPSSDVDIAFGGDSLRALQAVQIQGRNRVDLDALSEALLSLDSQ